MSTDKPVILTAEMARYINDDYDGASACRPAIEAIEHGRTRVIEPIHWVAIINVAATLEMDGNKLIEAVKALGIPVDESPT